VLLLAALLLAPAPTGWTQKLKDGTTVTLAAVTNFYSRKSWTPDGKPSKTWIVAPLMAQMIKDSKHPDPKLSKVSNFVFNIKPKAGEPSVVVKIGAKYLSYAYTLKDSTRGMWWAGAGADNSKLPSSVDLKVGVGSSKWRTTSTHDLGSGQDKGPKFFGNVLRVPARGTNPAMVLIEATIPRSIKGTSAAQVKIFDQNGTALASQGLGPVKSGGAPRYYFLDNGNRLVRAELQTQPYTWLTFKGVRVKPK